METYLSEHSCTSISVGPEKPAFACSESESSEVATTACIIREMGSKVCEKAGKEMANIDAPKFFKDIVAREGCGAAVHEFTGEQYNVLDKTIRRYTADLPVTILSAIIGWFSRDAKEVFDWAVAAKKAHACIPGATEVCRRKYLTWQVAVDNHLAQNEPQIRECQNARAALDSAVNDIANKQDLLNRAANVLTEHRTAKQVLEERRDRVDFQHALQSM